MWYLARHVPLLLVVIGKANADASHDADGKQAAQAAVSY